MRASRFCFALSLLCDGDLGLDHGHGAPLHRAADCGHGRLDDLGALLDDHGQQRGATGLDRA